MNDELLKQILGGLKDVKESVNRIEEKQNLIYNQTGKLTEYHTESMERFDHIDRQLKFFDYDLDRLNKKVATNEREINRIKQS